MGGGRSRGKQNAPCSDIFQSQSVRGLLQSHLQLVLSMSSTRRCGSPSRTTPGSSLGSAPRTSADLRLALQVVETEAPKSPKPRRQRIPTKGRSNGIGSMRRLGPPGRAEIRRSYPGEVLSHLRQLRDPPSKSTLATKGASAWSGKCCLWSGTSGY